MQKLEKNLKVLASRRRLALLKYLKEHREASVKELAGAIQLSFPATSRHLCILFAADIVEREQRKLQMFYRLSPRRTSITEHLLFIL